MLDIRTTFAAATAVLLTAAAVFSAPAAQAAESQFYFLGRVVVNDAVQPARTEVYLRWDVLEGQLPPDVTAFRVLRNGTAVEPDFPALTVKPVPEIAALYQEPGQAPRRLETITRLAELASDAGRPFSANQFAGELHALIDPAADTFNAFWSMLGSRTDFNVARARNRGWIDTAPAGAGGGDIAGYELLAVNAAGATVKVGELDIDLTQVQQPLGATGFRQIRFTDYRCDLPESGKDHYTVMLDWVSPGAAVVTDRVAAQAYIAGFDIYRTTENLDPSVGTAPARDIAALAAGAGVDSRGRPQIPGLEKVNVSLIVDPGKRVADPDWVAARDRLREAGVALPEVPAENVPVEPRWLEARDTLARAGVRPGDRRAYYLVPRDFTGNYGPTAATIVQVPYLTRPPAPWNVRTFPDRTSADLTGGPETLALTWDEVNVDTYADAYTGTRLFCNIIEATTTGLLDYAPLGGNCAAGRNNSVRLDVNRYRVYRFTDFDVAGRFRDSDGDGVEDKAEVPDLDGNERYDLFERSLGTQCDATRQPAGAPNYLIWPAAGSGAELSIPRQLNPNARPVVRLRDRVPALVERESNGTIIVDNRDAVYWYRIASEAATPAAPVGRLSHLSAPQRGIFPDRDPPPPPIVDVEKPGEVVRGCRVETDPDAPWSFEEEVSSAKDEKGTSFTISCASGSYTASSLLSPNTNQCQQIASQCENQDVIIDFPATEKTGGVACDDLAIPEDIDFCKTGSVRLVPDLVEDLVPAEPGDLVPGGVTVTVNQPNDPTSRTCIALFENMDGTSTRVGSTCDPGGLIDYRPRGGQFCGYAIASDENNNISAVVHIPCTLSPSNPKPPAPPQILNFAVDDSLARFTFRLPAEEVATTLARLDFEPPGGETVRSVESIPVMAEEPGATVSFNVPVDPRQETKDRFCLSLLSVARDDGVGRARTSDWSSERCFTRTASGEDLPEYLPWPLVAGVPQGEPLEAGFVSGFRELEPFLALQLTQSPALLPAPNGIQDFPDCEFLRPGQANSTDPIVPELAARNFDTYQCLSGGFARSRSAIADSLNFILYRQSRVQGSAEPPSDWIQVSPLIDYVHFDRRVVAIPDRQISIWTLNDPYIELVDNSDFSGNGVAVWFVDRYPFRLTRDNAGAEPYEWRYQAVYFDENQAPVEWRVSDWVGGAN